jgi:hypothetical protein
MSTPDVRALFAAAREDGPDDAERDAVFRDIAIATGVATATAAAVSALSAAGAASAVADAATSAAVEAGTSAGTASAAAAKSGGMFGFKLLAVGAALGAVSTALGVVLALTVVAPESSRGSGRVASTTAPAMVSPGAKLAQPEARKRDLADGNDAHDGDDDVTRGNAVRTGTGTSAHDIGTGSDVASASADVNGGGASDLGEEARLVTAARNALVAGDPAKALSLVQGTRKLSARSLEPEELGLEARALRALGRADDAAATELVLRRRYPDHALAR